MPKITIKQDKQPFKTQIIQCQNFKQLILSIVNIFKINANEIKIIIPKIINQTNFYHEIIQNQIKQITFINQYLFHSKQEIKKKKIQPIQYLNSKTHLPENIGIDYAIYPLYLLWMVGQFKEYFEQYCSKQKSAEAMLLQQLGITFRKMNQNNILAIIDPLEWISSWVVACSTDIEYPYPLHTIKQFLDKTFKMIEIDYMSQDNYKQDQINFNTNIVTKIFGLELLQEIQDITKLTGIEEINRLKLKNIKKIQYYLLCQINQQTINTLQLGINEGFKEKKLWRNYYTFDIEYKLKIKQITKLPKNLLLYVNRLDLKDEGQQIMNKKKQKLIHTIKYYNILDLYEFCSKDLKYKMDRNREKRQEVFQFLMKNPKYQQYKQYYTQQYKDRSMVELNYSFLQHLLDQINQLDQFITHSCNNDCFTGQYRLIGVIYHRGLYYCKEDMGQFMAIIHSDATRCLKIYKNQIQVVHLDELSHCQYWGNNNKDAWMPVLMLYKPIYLNHLKYSIANHTISKF